MEDRHWATGSFCHEEGGVLTIPGSGVLLRVPPKAVPPGKVYIIHGMVHTDLDEYRSLMSSDEEVIIGPVPEFIVESGEMFDEPVDIVLPHNQQPDKLRNTQLIYGEKGQYTNLQADDPDISYSAESDHICIHTKHFTRFIMSTGRVEEITDALLTVAVSKKDISHKAIYSIRLMLHSGCSSMDDFSEFRRQYYDPDMEEIVRLKITLPETKDAIPLPTICVELSVDDDCDATLRNSDTLKRWDIRIRGKNVLHLYKDSLRRSETLANVILESKTRQRITCNTKVTFDFGNFTEQVVEDFLLTYPMEEKMDNSLQLSERKCQLITQNKQKLLSIIRLTTSFWKALSKYDVITVTEIGEIQIIGTGRHSEIDELLKHVMRAINKRYAGFLRALAESGQEDIVTEILGEQLPESVQAQKSSAEDPGHSVLLTRDKKELLREKAPELITRITPSSLLWALMSKHGVIDQSDANNIQAVDKPDADKVFEVLKLIGTMEKYNGFVQSLVGSDQKKVVTDVLGEDINSFTVSKKALSSGEGSSHPARAGHQDSPPDHRALAAGIKMESPQEKSAEFEIKYGEQMGKELHDLSSEHEKANVEACAGGKPMEMSAEAEIKYGGQMANQSKSMTGLKNRQTADLFFHETGGVLQMPGSDVVLRIPPKAVPPGKVYVVHGTIHTNVKDYNPWMVSDDEYIISPVVDVENEIAQ